MKLLISALTKFLIGFLLVGALIFVPAGTVYFPNGWLFMVLLFVPILIVGAVLFVKSPTLLKERLDSKENQTAQKWVVGLAAILFLAGFIVAGLDFRFGWSCVPTPAVIVAAAIMIISYALYAEVLRENAYLSRTVKVTEGQKVIDTGLYGIVRHPMYAATIWLFLSIPVLLGSMWAILCFAPYVAVIAARITNEEKILTAQLQGYAEYKQKVKYRLIPFLW